MAKIKYWLPTVIWMAIIFSFSQHPSIQASSTSILDFIIKKMAHFWEYFILSTLLAYSLTKSTSASRRRTTLLAIVISIVYALTDEFHQSFVPGRTPAMRDIIIDITGALSAQIVILRSKRFWL
jgi:VanZ family protein